jgi:hypothetical protein
MHGVAAVATARPVAARLLARTAGPTHRLLGGQLDPTIVVGGLAFVAR